MLYIISDTHFNHKKVIEYEDRPFKNVEEMNKIIIENWNKTISTMDTIYHLGDFAWGNKGKIKKIVQQLNGYKILIKGNHDRNHSKTWWYDVGFNDVIDGSLILENKYILSHEPIEGLEKTNFINIHGHIHKYKMESPKYYNACVEHLKYTPILFDRIKEIYEK